MHAPQSMSPLHPSLPVPHTGAPMCPQVSGVQLGAHADWPVCPCVDVPAGQAEQRAERTGAAVALKASTAQGAQPTGGFFLLLFLLCDVPTGSVLPLAPHPATHTHRPASLS
jgi:hypothetical protein